MKFRNLLLTCLFLLSLSGSGSFAETLYSWTDTQGRTLQASFVKLEGNQLTIRMNGQDFPLDLSYFSPQSQNLARQLAAAASPSPTPPAPTPKPAPIPTPAPAPQQVEPAKPKLPKVLTDASALEAEHEWRSVDGRTLYAKFSSIDGTDLNILMSGGRIEQTIPLSRLSDASVEQAKKLQAIVDKQKQARAKMARDRKNMKIPELQPEDLKRYLDWTSSDGNKIEAAFVDTNEQAVTVLMKRSPDRPVEIPWERLSIESQAMAEGLKKLKIKLAPKAPRLGPYMAGKKNDEGLLTSSATLPRYLDGKWKNYNTVLESAVYDVALNANGKHVSLWLKDESEDENTAEGTRADRRPLQIYFRAWYDPSPETKTWDWRDRRIASFKNPPQVSSEREKTTIAGTLENGATFEYNIEISHRGLSFWGKINESRSEKYPTSLTIAFYSPNFIPNVTNMSLKEIEPLVGTGKMYLDPLESKRQQLDMMDKWTDIMGKARGTDWNPIKSAEFMGTPFGAHKIKVTPASTRGMHFTWGKGYSGVYPFQGIHLSHRTEDAYNARREKNFDDYKDRLEISKSKRLQVNISRGRG
ncbi:MAG: hypothetical protein VX153_01645 [Verrucomicrobiota bacterium]|nr:hypothetical protein [Verrucomicrobiota bacterium]